MDEILEKKKKQLGIYAKVAAGDSTSLLEYMLDIEEYLDSIKERFDEITKGKLRDVDYERIISESVGRIPTPKDGEKPSPKELIDIILPLIPEVKDGNDAVVDYEKIISEVVSQIHIPEDGKDGKDGSPDTSEDIRNKLELLEGDERLSVNAISGLDKFALVSDLKNIRTTVVGGGSANVQVLKNGMPVGSGAALDFRGAGIASVTHDGHTGVITITGGGGGGAAWGSISGTLSDQTDLNTALSNKLDTSSFNLSTFDTGDLTEGSNLYFTDERAQDAVGTILVDSSEIDFTYNDGTPSISASIVAGSIDETKLDASVNASLDLADSAVQNLSDLGITASTTELNYVAGVTSSIQTQLNSKQAQDALLDDISDLSDPNADRLMFWDDSNGKIDWLTLGSNLSITGTTLNASGRVGSTTSSATPSINTDSYDEYDITALAANITSMTTNLSGTPTNGQTLMLRFKDNGTARTITWGSSFISSGVATLLATTVISKTHYVGLRYDSTAAKWVCLAVDATGY